MSRLYAVETLGICGCTLSIADILRRCRLVHLAAPCKRYAPVNRALMRVDVDNASVFVYEPCHGAFFDSDHDSLRTLMISAPAIPARRAAALAALRLE